MCKATNFLAKSIVKASSLQTYYTIKLLADPPLIYEAYKAYAYFRWLDDQIDKNITTKNKRLNFIKRQKKIIENAYNNHHQPGLTPEEKIVAELIDKDNNPHSKLGSFIYNFFSIIEFDAYRKGKYISRKELNWYSKTLGIAVTDCIQHFIGHDTKYSGSKYQYFAATGAHIVHMLRDYSEDIPEGFINIPKEYLNKYKIKINDIKNPAFRAWVKERVLLARKNFNLGKRYIEEIPVLRCKIAAYWYCSRFEWLIGKIEKDNFILRNNYNSNLNKIAPLRSIIGSTLALSIKHLLKR